MEQIHRLMYSNPALAAGPDDITSPASNSSVQGIGNDVPGAQRTLTVRNPYISPISPGYLRVIIPKNPKVEHKKYHGSTRT